MYAEVLEIARAIGDRVGESSALNNLGVAKSMGGDPAAALSCWEASLALRRTLRYFRGVAECLNNLGIAHYTAGRPAAALESYGEALAITRQIGDRRGEGLAELNLGESYIDLSLYAQALEHSERSRTIAESIGDRDLTLRSLVQLGGIRGRTGEIERLAELRIVLAGHDPGADPFGRGRSPGSRDSRPRSVGGQALRRAFSTRRSRIWRTPARRASPPRPSSTWPTWRFAAARRAGTERRRG